MAVKLPKVGEVLASGNPKQRIFLLLLVFLVLIVILMMAMRFLGGGKSTASASRVTRAPNISSVQGGSNLSEQQVKSLREGNVQRASKASKTGTSALPTMIDASQSGLSNNFSGGGSAAGSCAECCAGCDGGGSFQNQLANLRALGEISPTTYKKLLALATAGAPAQQFGDELQRLVTSRPSQFYANDPSKAPGEARKLLSAYGGSYADQIAAAGAATMDKLVRNKQLPLGAANDLLALQKKNVPESEYEAELNRLIAAGKISPATAKKLSAQYQKQKQKNLRAETQAQLADMVASDSLSSEAGKKLDALQGAKVSPGDYAASLKRMLDNKEISADAARKLLAQYNKEHGIGQSTAAQAKGAGTGIDSDLAALQQQKKLSAATAGTLKGLASKGASVDDYADGLKRLVQEGKISPETASSLLAQYQKEHAAKSAAVGELNNLVDVGKLSSELAAKLAAMLGKNVSVADYAAELARLVKAGKMSSGEAARLLAQYKKLHVVAGDSDKLLSNLSSEPELSLSAANSLKNLQAKGVSESAYASTLKRLVSDGSLSSDAATKLLSSYKQKVAQFGQGAVGQYIPGSTGFAAGGQGSQVSGLDTSGFAASGGAVLAGGQVVTQATAQQQRQQQAQKQKAASQQREQEISQISQRMSQQAQQFVGNNWATVAQVVVAGQVGDTEAAAAGSAAAVAGAQNEASSAATDGAPMIKAGAILYAVLDTAVDSDYSDSPVMATITVGEYRGAKLLGKVNTVKNGQRVMLQFNLMNRNDWQKGKTITAYAIDADTARSALATSVNNHYLLRYGTLFASSFMSGMATAISDSGSTTTTNSDGSSYVSNATYSTPEKIAIALGEVGTNASSAMATVFDTAPTVRVKAGVPIAILFMVDVTT